MTGQKYSIEKIIQILSEAKMTSISAVCRKYDVCSSTFYRWQKQYSGFSSDQAKKLAILESENASLKKLVAEKELENAALRDFIKKNDL
ncbi:MAG TPA: transposase [Thermotogota bacterium]|nr:transposase [Thermotogota bacterium]